MAYGYKHQDTFLDLEIYIMDTQTKPETKPELSPPLISRVEATEEGKPLKFQMSFTYEYRNKAGELLVGTFTARRLTLSAISQLEVFRAQLNGGQTIAEYADFINYMIAYCRVALVDTPDWWKPEEFYDIITLQHVYNHVKEWESSFR